MGDVASAGQAHAQAVDVGAQMGQTMGIFIAVIVFLETIVAGIGGAVAGCEEPRRGWPRRARRDGEVGPLGEKIFAGPRRGSASVRRREPHAATIELGPYQLGSASAKAAAVRSIARAVPPGSSR